MKQYVLTILMAISLDYSVVYSAPSELNLAYIRERACSTTEEFAKCFAGEHNLYFVRTASCSAQFKTAPGTSFILGGTQQLTLHDAKQLLITAVKEYVQFAVHNQYLQNYAHNGFIERYSFPFKINKIGIRITLWDEKKNRRMPPYIAQMNFFNGTYHYYVSNEHQELIEVYKEQFVRPSNITSLDDMLPS